MPAGHGVQRIKGRVFVVFQDRGERGFWRFWCRRAWTHCWVFLPAYYPEPGLLARTYTIKVEPLRWGIDVRLWPACPEVVAAEFLKSGVTAILEVDVDIKNPDRWVARGPITCVAVVKAVLGIANWRIWTPWQLFQYLLGRGAIFIKPEE